MYGVRASFGGPVEVPPWSLPDENREVGLRYSRADLLEKALAEVGEVGASGRGIGVLSLEVCNDAGVRSIA